MIKLFNIYLHGFELEWDNAHLFILFYYYLIYYFIISVLPSNFTETDMEKQNSTFPPF